MVVCRPIEATEAYQLFVISLTLSFKVVVEDEEVEDKSIVATRVAELIGWHVRAKPAGEIGVH